ncbi:MAG TPA: SDR family NAD(P)-dependent oxidoreductase [Polyangiaceae bacterium]|nr:SDR family NAD(P)-dependent oxidoreductase [Polyangiaceae bacterium]
MALLEGKVAIVTGAGAGIGRATALALAREGASVLVNDYGGARDGTGHGSTPADEVVAEIRAAGGNAEPNYESVSDEAGAARIVQSAVERFGRLDVLINNAGILRDKTLLKLQLTDWQAVLDVHLTGTFLCLRAAAAKLKDQGQGGSIVNTTSVSGLLGNLGQANYAAAKAGIYGLTRTASIELQRYGIRVNAVAPLAKTRMTAELPLFEKIGDSLSPEHVAPVHVYLASDLSREVTGVTLSVAGGRISQFKLVETAGRHKDDERGIWTPAEIAEQFAAIAKT